MNKYGQVVINMYLLKDIELQNTNDEIARFLNYIMGKDEYLSNIHRNKNRFKGYSFSGLYPIEKDKIYKANDIYGITIRSYDMQFINKIISSFENAGNDTFQVIGVEKEILDHKIINEIETLTPSIATITTLDKRTRCWDRNNKLYDINDIIFKNIINKYNYINKVNSNFSIDDIIERIDILNNVAIILKYKNTKLLGYKYKIKFKKNVFAQELANFIVVTGLLEKNSSLGCGFVKVIC